MEKSDYYLPNPSQWPLVGCFALFILTAGIANWLHRASLAPYFVGLGICILIYMMYGWFGAVIQENREGLLSTPKMARSFRLGMIWFIFSEICFFAAFLGALFYTRTIAVPSLGGHDGEVMTHLLIWPHFKSAWPLLSNPNPAAYKAPLSVMPTWDIPAINTLILLTSGATLTMAHWALLKGQRIKMLIAQALTIALGMVFLMMQAHEYGQAYFEKGLTLASGIYGTTFFMLTGFHALHVTIGTICLIVIFYRMFKRDFNSDHHFAFEAVAWYWHFVDIVWLLLFVLVYWL